MRLASLLRAPQLGEYVWHEQSIDASVDEVSQRHFVRMKELVDEVQSDQPVRLLELGAYRHYAGHRIADEFGAEVWLSDISARALELGRSAAIDAGCVRLARACAADFHDLPFADGSFDVVFIASAVHHTTRPERVLHELARVTRPGGLLWLENEPVGRSSCIYLYNVNRAESYTPYELALADAGLLRWLSSPFHGTRPEQLFEMVENDRIPLELFLHAFNAAGEIVHLRLDTSSTRQALELELEALCDVEDAEARVWAALHERVARAGEPDKVSVGLGVRAPTSAELWTLARRFVDGYRFAAVGDAERREHATVRLYGAALQTKVRRAGCGPRSESVLRRELLPGRGVDLDLDGPGGAAFMGWRKSLPDVFDPARRAEVQELYEPLGWTTVVEQSGAISLANVAGSVRFPEPTTSALLLVRLYTVPRPDAPYRIVVRQGGRPLGDAIVVQAESRLFRGLVHAGAGEIHLEHFDADGRPIDLTFNLRMSVAQLLSIDD